MPTAALIGSRCVLTRGNGDSGVAAVRASRTMGSGASGLIIYWGTGGTAGNSKTCSIVVAGNNTPLSVVVTTSAVTINSATNGSAAATSTVAQVLALLNADAVFKANWKGRAVGDGTGVVGAASSASLAGGAAGETFTAIAEVKGVQGPSLSGGTVDVTSFDSGAVREFISTLVDAGTISFTCNYLPNAAGTGQQLLLTDLRNQSLRNFVLTFSDLPGTELSFAAIIVGGNIDVPLEQAVTINVTAKISGWVTYF